MDELRGPTIQIVLHIKEGKYLWKIKEKGHVLLIYLLLWISGLGFGFLKNPFIVSGSLNGYLLETDPAVPCHGPIFDAELVWEADKRRFRKYVHWTVYHHIKTILSLCVCWIVPLSCILLLFILYISVYVFKMCQ